MFLVNSNANFYNKYLSMRDFRKKKKRREKSSSRAKSPQRTLDCRVTRSLTEWFPSFKLVAAHVINSNEIRVTIQ